MEIIILPGWRQDDLVWKNITNQLGSNAKCLVLPGFAKKIPSHSNWSIPDYAIWTENNIDNKKDTVLIGHSFGGRVATEIASKNPKWLKGLILSGAPCLYRPNNFLKLKIKVFHHLKYFIPHKLKSAFLPKDLKQARNMGMEQIFRKAVNYDQTVKLKKITIPTLLVWGEYDNEVPLSIANEINNTVNNSILKIIDNAGHNSFIDNPTLFYGYVKNFIKNIK